MQTFKHSEILYTCIRTCVKCKILTVYPFHESMIEVCSICKNLLQFIDKSNFEISNTFISILMKSVSEKDERIRILETQFKQLETRIGQLEFSGPTPKLPSGGTEFQKIINEAKQAGDFE